MLEAPKKPGDAGGVLQDVLGVLGLGDRAAVAQGDDVRLDRRGRVADRLDQLGRLLEGEGRRGPDRALRGQPHVGHDHVRAGLRHRARLVGVEDVRRRQEAGGMGGPDHVDLEAVAHARLFEVLAELAVAQADGREVLDAREADPLDLLQEDGHQAERIGATDAGQDRGLAHDRQDLAGHLHDDRVGVAVGHAAGQRAAAGHPVATRVVDDDEVGPAGLRALRREAGARPRAHDHAALVEGPAKPRQCLLPVHARPPAFDAFAAAHARYCASSRSAIAVAKAGSLISVAISTTSTSGRSPAFSSRMRAASAAGS